MATELGPPIYMPPAKQPNISAFRYDEYAVAGRNVGRHVESGSLQ